MRNRLSPSVGAPGRSPAARLGSASSATVEGSVARRRAEVRAPPPRRRSPRVFVQLVTSVDLGQVESRYGSGAAMAKWVGEAAMTAAAVVGLSRGSRSSRSSGEKSRSRKVTISTRGSRAAMAGDGGGGGWWRRAKASRRWRHGGGRRRAKGGDVAGGGGGPEVETRRRAEAGRRAGASGPAAERHEGEHERGDEERRARAARQAERHEGEHEREDEERRSTRRAARGSRAARRPR